MVVLNTCVVRQSAEDKAVGKLGSLKPWRKRPARRHAWRSWAAWSASSPASSCSTPIPMSMSSWRPARPRRWSTICARPRSRRRSQPSSAQQLAQRYRIQDEAQPIGTTQSIKHLALSGEAPVAAYVPIVYGCSHACTFCIIPFRRGVERSRPLDEIVNEVRGLVDQGVREVTLLGQIVDRYGYDWREGGLGNSASVDAFNGTCRRRHSATWPTCCAAVHEIDGLWRIRFLTSHPNYMTDRILETVRDLPKVCEHIEVPIQAGDDEVLERMRRGYTSADYRALVASHPRHHPGRGHPHRHHRRLLRRDRRAVRAHGRGAGAT